MAVGEPVLPIAPSGISGEDTSKLTWFFRDCFYCQQDVMGALMHLGLCNVIVLTVQVGSQLLICI